MVSEREGSGGSSSQWPGLDLPHKLLEHMAGSPRDKLFKVWAGAC